LPTLFHEPEAPENAPEPGGQPTPDSSAQAPDAVVERLCSNCGAPLADGQEWCLECGTPVTEAARVRGGLPGWRTAAAVIAVTLVMASGAVAAAYAALRSDDPAPTQVAQVGQTTATATIPQPDPIDIPQETAAETAAAAPPADASADTPAPAPLPDASAPLPTPTYTPPAVTPVTPVTPAQTPATPTTQPDTGSQGSDSGNGVGSSGPVKRAALVQVPLDPATTVASAYNPVVPGSAAATPPAGTTTDPATGATTTAPTTTDPATGATTTDPATGATTTSPATTDAPAHAAGDFHGEPKLAFDGDPKTAWTVTLPTPALVADPQAGLLIDLGDAATKLRRLTLTPTTPGTTIVVYGTNDATAPATLKDKGWKKLATQLDVTGKTNITLGDDVTGTAKVRQVLIWFAQGPDDGTSTSVGISELKLYK
jgi:hypothetical protein